MVKDRENADVVTLIEVLSDVMDYIYVEGVFMKLGSLLDLNVINKENNENTKEM